MKNSERQHCVMRLVYVGNSLGAAQEWIVARTVFSHALYIKSHVAWLLEILVQCA